MAKKASPVWRVGLTAALMLMLMATASVAQPSETDVPDTTEDLPGLEAVTEAPSDPTSPSASPTTSDAPTDSASESPEPRPTRRDDPTSEDAEAETPSPSRTVVRVRSSALEPGHHCDHDGVIVREAVLMTAVWVYYVPTPMYLVYPASYATHHIHADVEP